MPQQRSYHLGIGAVIAAAMLWGTTGTLQSFMSPEREPLVVGALRLLIGAIFLSLLALSQARCRAAIHELPWKKVCVAGAAIAAYNLLFFAAVSHAGVGIGTVIAIGSAPLWAAAYDVFILKQPPSKLQFLGQIFSIGGVGLLISTGLSNTNTDSDGFVIGMILALGAGASYAIYSLAMSQIGPRIPSALTAASCFCIAALCASPALVMLPTSWISGPQDWGLILTLGIGATGLSYVLYTWGLRHVAPSSAVTLALAEPMTAWGLAVLLIGEAVTRQNLMGVGGILIGLTLVAAFPNRQPATA